MEITREMVEALAHLRTYAKRYPSMGLSEAINTLDNGQVFAALDGHTDYAPAEEVLTEAAGRTLNEKLGPLDPAEWGDTTRADMARHQGTGRFLVDPHTWLNRSYNRPV